MRTLILLFALLVFLSLISIAITVHRFDKLEQNLPQHVSDALSGLEIEVYE